MPDLTLVDEAAAKLQQQLAIASLSDLKQTLAGIKRCPHGVQIDSTTVPTALIVNITAENGCMFRAYIEHDRPIVRGLTADGNKQFLGMNITAEEMEKFKNDFHKALKDSPEIANLLKGAQFPDYTAVELPKEQSPTQPKIQR